MEQLLTVSTKILAALQKQDKSVQELSTKMDNNFAGLTEKLESYLAEQQTLRQKKLQTEAYFYSGLERQNAALTSIFDNDSKETEEYIKKSNAFNEQMMSLIQAKAKEEETFLKSRYLTLGIIHKQLQHIFTDFWPAHVGSFFSSIGPSYDVEPKLV